MTELEKDLRARAIAEHICALLALNVPPRCVEPIVRATDHVELYLNKIANGINEAKCWPKDGAGGE